MVLEFDFQDFVGSHGDPLLLGREIVIMNDLIRYSEGVNNPLKTSSFSVTLRKVLIQACLESIQMVTELSLDGLGKYSIIVSILVNKLI